MIHYLTIRVFFIYKVNELPKFNTLTNINLINQNVILYYAFSSKNCKYELCFLHQLNQS